MASTQLAAAAGYPGSSVAFAQLLLLQRLLSPGGAGSGADDLQDAPSLLSQDFPGGKRGTRYR